jgi:hypothetical protein
VARLRSASYGVARKVEGGKGGLGDIRGESSLLDMWLMNKHLLPFTFMFVLGGAIFLAAWVLCFLRTGRIPIFPYMNFNHLNRDEKKWLWVGAAMASVGLIGLGLIPKFYGYFYLDMGVLTWTKG